MLELGDTIEEPHDYYCSCKACRGGASFDELRFSKTRLYAYKGLASEVYISLSSKDPILTAFELGDKLRCLGMVEKYFRVSELINSLSSVSPGQCATINQCMCIIIIIKIILIIVIIILIIIIIKIIIIIVIIVLLSFNLLLLLLLLIL